MKSNKKYVIGLDFGTDSCRALVVDTYTDRMKKRVLIYETLYKKYFQLAKLAETIN